MVVQSSHALASASGDTSDTLSLVLVLPTSSHALPGGVVHHLGGPARVWCVHTHRARWCTVTTGTHPGPARPGGAWPGHRDWYPDELETRQGGLGLGVARGVQRGPPSPQAIG